MRIEISAKARTDLFSIYLDGCELFSVQQAERYAADLRTAIGHLAAFPEMGRLDTDIVPPIRRLACGAHVVWHDVTGQSVIIQRITHERMLPAFAPHP
jgi:plasmid stabilization system protein ParE